MDQNEKHYCAVCNKESANRCGSCKSIWYCCQEHQNEHWRIHKLNCSEMKQKFLSNQKQQKAPAKPAVKPVEKPAVKSVENPVEKPFEKVIQLFVYNLSSITTEKQLEEYFSKVGTVISVFIPYSRTVKRGFGLITMKYNYSSQAQFDKSNNQNNDDELLEKLTDGINNTMDFEQQVIIIKDPSFQFTPGANESQKIEQIFTSNDLNDERRTQKLNDLLIQYQKEITEKILLIFEVETLSVIQSNLNNCTTASEISLLNIVDLITERNALHITQDISKFRKKTILLTDIRKSYLDTKIERILKIKFAEDEKNEIKQYSELTEQLVRIFLNINKGQDIGPDMIQMSVSVIAQKINSLKKGDKHDDADIIQTKMEKDNSTSEEEQEEERNRKLDQLKKILNALGGASRYNINMQKRIIDQLKIQNCIEFILDINCEKDPIKHDGKVSPQLRDFYIGIQKVLKNQMNKDTPDQEQEQQSKQQDQEQQQSKQAQFKEQEEDEEEEKEKEKYQKEKMQQKESEKDKKERQEEDGDE